MNNNDAITRLSYTAQGKTKRITVPEIRKLACQLIKENADISDMDPSACTECDFLYFDVLLPKCKDFYAQIDLLEKHFDSFRSWDTVDNNIVAFKKPIDFNYIYPRAMKYINDPNPFVRRFGYVLFIKADLNNINNLIKIEKLFKDDSSYVVQMGEAWLLSEMYVHDPQETYDYLSKSTLPYQIITKAISKTTDSFRVSDEEKMKVRSLRQHLRIR
jgi:YD repeat-containing protein